MGDRAVICHESVNKNNKHEHLGIYVHWHGCESYIKQFMEAAKNAKVRHYSTDDSYCMARLCQVIANIIDGNEQKDYGIGINTISNLDYDNGDNGVYYFNDNFDIVKHTDGKELN